ncbi:MAG: hypothetical protein COY47_05560 [Chloroflexi bacterium CG_4_10_14_0_8_um_filter_57_5]|nr:MAG: hypothetical protein COY47_05560 [Chloroflexi bacterium CG_4_10_14_0_8_um_filter_57_5]PJH76597.1 MAG: hypothetical protein CO064_00350 [Anaerolineae bacterium CG_4_9_14_0_8_um_filter_58_9]
MNNQGITQLLSVIGQLPEDRITEILDFARFLLWQETVPEEATPFERWAEEIAKSKGFSALTEKDIVQIVHEGRRAA